MKKILVYILIATFLNIFSPVFAKVEFKNIRGTQLQKTEKNSLYGLVEKDSKKIILPIQYNKIKKVKIEDNEFILAEKENLISIHSMTGYYNDFLEKYYKSNNKLQNVKFKNYPKQGVIKFKQGNKFGLIFVQKDILHVTKPIYQKIIFPDENSIMARMLNVTYAPLDNIIAYTIFTPQKNQYVFTTAQNILSGSGYKTGYAFLNPAQIKEELIFNENKLTVNYNDISYTNADNYLILKNKKIGVIDTNRDSIIIEKNLPTTATTPNFNINSLLDIYNSINKYSQIEVKNYPINGILKIKNKLYLFEDNKISNISIPYVDFDLDDEKALINKFTGLNLSYQNNNNIIAKKNLWGIIDKNKNENVPFIYDFISTLSPPIEEKVNYSDGKITLEFVDKKESTNYFIAKKGKTYGIINDKNEIIVPFNYIKYSENNELIHLKNEINKKSKNDYNTEQKRRLKYNIANSLLYMIWLPVMLIFPPSASFYYGGSVSYF